MKQRGGYFGPGAAKRMSQRNRAPVYVHLLLIQPELANNMHSLRSERFVDFKQIDIGQR
ncbi:hypothetical protein D3C84_1215090 [compost metagenome]